MIVNGYSYPTVNQTALSWWLPRLTWLSTFSYGLTKEGTVTNLSDEELVREANNAGVRPVMTLAPLDEEGRFDPQNFIAVLNDPTARKRLIEQIESNIRVKSMGGVNFDIEYLPKEYAAAYAELVRDTREALAPRGWLTTDCLAPEVSARELGQLS